jgi:hypothetical protein
MCFVGGIGGGVNEETLLRPGGPQKYCYKVNLHQQIISKKIVAQCALFYEIFPLALKIEKDDFLK